MGHYFDSQRLKDGIEQKLQIYKLLQLANLADSDAHAMALRCYGRIDTESRHLDGFARVVQHTYHL